VTLADVLTAVASLAIAGAGFASMAVILSLFMPGAVGRATARIANRKGLSFAIGLVGLFALLSLAGALLKVPSPAARIAAILVILGGLATALLGGVALARTLAARVRIAEGPLGLRDLLRGVFLLETAVLLPIVGWFLVLPAAFLISLGAGFLSLWPRASRAAAITSPAESA
jgi:hypothetical protein